METMLDVPRILTDGTILAAFASSLLLVSLRVNPRIWLHAYPRDIQGRVPPKSESERRQSLAFGLPFLLLLIAVPLASTFALKNRNPAAASFPSLAGHAFGVAFVFNVVDWLVLDWLLLCCVTPAFMVIPGSEGASGYKDYGFHFRGFLIGTLLSGIAGLLIGLSAWLV
jgi:hypothetical protein